MAFAIPLNLRRLNQGLLRAAAAGIGRRHWPAIGACQLKHQSIGQVGIVRNGKDFAARLLFISIHIVPKLIGAGADKGGEGQNLICLILAIAHDDDTVEIVALAHQRIFKAHKGSEFAGAVIAVDNAGMVLPDIGGALFHRLGVHHIGRQCPLRKTVDQFHRNFLRFRRAFLQFLVPAPQRRIRQQKTRRVMNLLQRSQTIRMVGDDKKIERPGKLCL